MVFGDRSEATNPSRKGRKQATRGVWLAGHLPAGEANAFREVLLFKLASDRIMPRVSQVGEGYAAAAGLI
jgi:hypothetical protein